VYCKYAVKNGLGYAIELSDLGHVILRVTGIGCEKAFSNEAGKHVVQRVPDTERNGRRQTSIVSVAVLPLPPVMESGLIPESEIEVKCQCGGGPGGQNVNKTASTVRMKHKPTGLSVIICNERDQFKNKKLAHRILSARVFEQKNNKAAADYNTTKRQQLGGGNRGDKVRTYNFIESRVVDHRLGTKTSNIKSIMKGELQLILN